MEEEHELTQLNPSDNNNGDDVRGEDDVSDGLERGVEDGIAIDGVGVRPCCGDRLRRRGIPVARPFEVGQSREAKGAACGRARGRSVPVACNFDRCAREAEVTTS